MKNQIYSNYRSSPAPNRFPQTFRAWTSVGKTLSICWMSIAGASITPIDQSSGGAEPTGAGRAFGGSIRRTIARRRIQQSNVEILKRRVAAFKDIERSVKLVEGQLQSIENFFGLVNDQVVTLPTPERVSRSISNSSAIRLR